MFWLYFILALKCVQMRIPNSRKKYHKLKIHVTENPIWWKVAEYFNQRGQGDELDFAGNVIKLFYFP